MLVYYKVLLLIFTDDFPSSRLLVFVVFFFCGQTSSDVDVLMHVSMAVQYIATVGASSSLTDTAGRQSNAQACLVALFRNRKREETNLGDIRRVKGRPVPSWCVYGVVKKPGVNSIAAWDFRSKRRLTMQLNERYDYMHFLVKPYIYVDYV